MKEMSARKSIALGMVMTYCLILLGMTILTIMKIVEVPVFLAFLTGFTGNVGMVITFYFLKNRPKENGGGTQ